MDIKIIEETNTVIVVLDERIDTINSSKFEHAIEPILNRKENLLIFDCESLDYISSAGLRVILTAQKKITANGGRFKMINVDSKVNSLFVMTGFAKIIDMELKYK